MVAESRIMPLSRVSSECRVELLGPVRHQRPGKLGQQWQVWVAAALKLNSTARRGGRGLSGPCNSPSSTDPCC